MTAPIRDLTARIIQVPTEIHSDTGGTVIVVRRRAKPQVVIESIGDGHGIGLMGGFAIIRDSTGQPAAHRLQFSDSSVTHEFADAAEIPIGPLLASGLPDDSIALDRVGHRPPVGHGERKRLLTVDILPGVGRRDGDDGVPVIWCADIDCVDIVAPDDVSEILIRRAAHAIVVFVHDPLRRFAAPDASVPITGAFFIHIANGSDANAVVSQKVPQPVGSVVPRTNESHRDFIAWRIRPQHG